MGFLDTLLTAINEQQAASAFGPDWRLKERRARLDERQAELDATFRRAQTLKATREWDAKLRAAQQLHPDLAPEEALAKAESEDISLEREGKRSTMALQKANELRALREPIPRNAEPLEDVVVNGRRVLLPRSQVPSDALPFDKPSQRQPSIFITPTAGGFVRGERKMGGALEYLTEPGGAGAAGVEGGAGGNVLKPRPREGELSAAGLFADMGAAVSNLQQMVPALREKLGLMRGAGPRAAIGQYTGSNRDLVAARNEAARLFDLVYVKSGKQINEQEKAVLTRYLPDINQDPDVFVDNLGRFVESLRNIARARGLEGELPDLFDVGESEFSGGAVISGSSQGRVEPAAGSQRKVVDGKTYVKVPGGWQAE